MHGAMSVVRSSSSEAILSGPSKEDLKGTQGPRGPKGVLVASGAREKGTGRG